jgi:hypothetical protein
MVMIFFFSLCILDTGSILVPLHMVVLEQSVSYYRPGSHLWELKLVSEFAIECIRRYSIDVLIFFFFFF